MGLTHRVHRVPLRPGEGLVDGVRQSEVGPRHARYARVEPDLPRKWRACHPNIVVSDGTSCARAWVSSTSDSSRLSSCAGRRACARVSLAHRPAKDSTGITLATPPPRLVGRAARLPAARVRPPPWRVTRPLTALLVTAPARAVGCKAGPGSSDRGRSTYRRWPVRVPRQGRCWRRAGWVGGCRASRSPAVVLVAQRLVLLGAPGPLGRPRSPRAGSW